MNPNHYIGCLLLFMACMLAAFRPAEKPKKPNVLVIYTDDHRFSGIHALGGQAVFTPHMDQLAHEGIAFTQTFLQGSFSGATCIPSRAMLLTGRGLFDLNGVGYSIPAEHAMMGEAFRDAGYHSHIVGKWHQDNKSLGRGFDSGSRINSRGLYLVDQYRMPLWDWRKDGNYQFKDGYLFYYDEDGKVARRPISKNDKRGPIGTEKTGPHISEIFADDAIAYLNNYKEKKPFFMYLAFPTPHDPRQAPQKYKDMYPEKDINLPPSYLPQHPFDKADLLVRDEKLAAWPRTPAIARKELSDYYAIISHLDAQIGRVIGALKASGEYENTLILLAGDSGLGVGNHGLIGKQNIYDEDGIHVPFIISGGKVKGQGRRIDALSYIHDIFPTLCDLVGIEIPTSVNGKSLLPVIDRKQDQIRDYSYHAYKQFERAYRKGDYKLIEFVRANGESRQRGKFVAGSKVSLLFNIKVDPWETTDLSWREGYAETLSQMRKEMKQKASIERDEAKRLGYAFDFWDFY